MIKFLAIALLVYIAWRMLRGDVRRKFKPGKPREALAVETVQCAKCGMYLPQGMEKPCDRADCPYATH